MIIWNESKLLLQIINCRGWGPWEAGSGKARVGGGLSISFYL